MTQQTALVASELINQLPRTATIKDRLEAYSMPEPNSGCWLWLGSVKGGEYGQIRIHCVNMFAHRVSYEEYVGPIPEETQVLHRCDTPSCINPSHLFLGTQRDNMEDMAAKGRGRGPQKEYEL